MTSCFLLNQTAAVLFPALLLTFPNQERGRSLYFYWFRRFARPASRRPWLDDEVSRALLCLVLMTRLGPARRLCALARRPWGRISRVSCVPPAWCSLPRTCRCCDAGGTRNLSQRLARTHVPERISLYVSLKRFTVPSFRYFNVLKIPCCSPRPATR